MKLILKVIILFLIVFNFRVSVFYNSVVISMIIATGYYFLRDRKIPFTYFNMRYLTTIMIASVLMTLVVITITLLHGEYFILVIKRFYVMLLMLAALIYALPILLEDVERLFEDAAVIICYTFALQGLIHLTGFLYTPFGEFIYSSKPASFHAFMEANPFIDKFRGYALTGSIFFELPSAYGVACIVFFRLQLIESRKYLPGIRGFIVFFLIFAGICLSGRTGFIGIGIGIGYYLFFQIMNTNRLRNDILRVIAATFVVVLAFYTLPSKQRTSLTEDVFPFAFEAYFNYTKKGTISTASTDVTQEYHYFPLRDETLIWGHGVPADYLLIYDHTDAGFMNNVIFGGVFYELLLLIYQSLYFLTPIAIARSRNTKEFHEDIMFFILLFIYILLLEYKATALGTQHITEVLFMLLGSTYIMKHTYSEYK